MISITCADVLDWCESYSGPRFHALLTDAPYQYGFMGRSWDSTGITYQPETWASLAEHLHPGAFLMVFGGARSWHGLAVALEDAGLIIHPTIFIWAQGQGFPKATRIDTQIDKRKGYRPGFVKEVVTYLQKARDRKGLTNKEIDDAFGFNGMAGHWCGFSQPEIPRLEHWPKLKELLDLDDSLDEAIEAHEREVIGKHPDPAKSIYGSESPRDVDVTAPATDLARAWQGHRYGLQALKPAVEPIIVAQKPYAGRPVDSIVDTGAGALWIDGGRVNVNSSELVEPSGDLTSTKCHHGYQRPNRSMFNTDKPKERGGPSNPSGRWPPNFALIHCPSHLLCQQCQAVHPIQPVVEVCPDCGGELERVEGCKRVGVKRVKGSRIEKPCDYEGEAGIFGNDGDRPARGIGDPDGRETVADFRCLPQCPARKLGEQAGESVSKGGFPKNLDNERLPWIGSIGPTTGGLGDEGSRARYYPQADWQHEVAEQLAQADPVHYCPKSPKKERNNGLDDSYWRRDKDSPTGFVRITQEEWEALPRQQRARGNIHSTVKPLSLLKWIAALLLPPPEYAPR